MSVLVEQVAETLGRAHRLFGDPPESGGAAAQDAATTLIAAGDTVRTGVGWIHGLSGEFASSFTNFGDRAAPALDGLAATDQRLSDRLRDAAGADRTGRASSGGVIHGAAADTAALAPYTRWPAGQKALLAALRARVVHQQQVVAAYRVRDAKMAALLRSFIYAARTPAPSGGMPSGSNGSGLGLGTASPIASAVPRTTGDGGHGRQPHTVLAGRLDRRAESVPAGAGGAAAAAALSKRGTPYVWGAKGPEQFDCSGLTQWAWARAGVRLGPDTYTQVTQGVPVAPGDVRAGDLIFPKDSFDSRGPGHVQLAISPTEVVHAPQTGDVVRVAPMPSAYVARRPVPVSDAQP
jgi:cell wall-associated NlpC family hydrolase